MLRNYVITAFRSLLRNKTYTMISARWLHRKFAEHLGTGAKNLAEIVRFKQFYHAFSTAVPPEMLKQYIYKYY